MDANMGDLVVGWEAPREEGKCLCTPDLPARAPSQEQRWDEPSSSDAAIINLLASLPCPKVG